MEAIEWIRRCVGEGAGEVVVNSMDTDGVKQGFDIELLTQVCDAVKVPVIASGGAGKIEDFIELFRKPTSAGPQEPGTYSSKNHRQAHTPSAAKGMGTPAVQGSPGE